MPETIAYLEQTFGVTVTTATDPAIRTDIVVTIGKATPDLEAPPDPDPAGPLSPAGPIRSGSASARTRAAGRGPRRSSGRGPAAPIGPISPEPTGRWSTSMTGEIWTPVPHRNISSATYSSERSIERTSTGMPSLREQLDDRLAGHALEQVVVDRRGQRDAVADDEQVRRRRLVDVAVGGQDDRLVEAVELGLGLLEGHVHVAADDLAAGRQRLVGVPPPGRGHDPDAGVGVDVVPERQRDDVQLVVEVVEPDADRPGRLVERRAGCRRPRGSRCGGPSRR